jgi:peptide/nickel transport system substrate-binding protein
MENELDPERRLAHWRRIQQIYTEELPVLPLFFRASPYILPKWLEGVRPTGHVQQTTLWIEHWRRAG